MSLSTLLFLAPLAEAAPAPTPCVSGDATRCPPAPLTLQLSSAAKITSAEVELRAEGAPARLEQVSFVDGRATLADVPAHVALYLEVRDGDARYAKWLWADDQRPRVLKDLWLGEPEVRYVDATGAPIPGLGVGPWACVTSLVGGCRGSGKDTVALPGSLLVDGEVAAKGLQADGRTVKLPVYPLELEPRGPIYREDDPGDLLFQRSQVTVVGLWLPVGRWIHEYEDGGAVWRQVVTVSERGKVRLEKPEEARGVSLRLAPETPAEHWGVRDADFPAVRVSADEVVAYPRTWPAPVQVWGGAGGEAVLLLEQHETTQIVRFPPDRTVDANFCWPGFELEPHAQGLWVLRARKEAPVAAGDLILSLDGTPVTGWTARAFEARLVEAGADVRLMVRSGPETREVSIAYRPDCYRR